ncbi:hypothetical protein AMK16_00340 [Streptomyces sp. CB00455]|nr:hypothetical protein AMK16_00340 [Streptomyces sp. CB00455]
MQEKLCDHIRRADARTREAAIGLADKAVGLGGCWHPLRLQRVRLDVAVDDVPRFGHGPADRRCRGLTRC